MSFCCAKCSKAVVIDNPGRVSFREECPHCRADLHSCINCRFYDTAAYNSCKESNAERVVDKVKANYCDYFEYSSGQGGKQSESASQLRKLDDLFKK